MESSAWLVHVLQDVPLDKSGAVRPALTPKPTATTAEAVAQPASKVKSAQKALARCRAPQGKPIATVAV